MRKSILVVVVLLVAASWTPSVEAGTLCEGCWETSIFLVGNVAQCSTIDPGSSWTKKNSGDCSCGVVSNRCNTRREPCSTIGGDCSSGGGDEWDDDGGVFNDDGGTSPIIIDLDGRGFELVGLGDAVSFDIDADGVAETVSWTSADGGEAFLVLDRNANGAVDDGSELFGTATAQPASDHPNGYRALAVFDGADEGGDGDGWISAADAVWGALQLWSDLNHDGVAQPLELAPLGAFDIDGIDLAYVDAQRRDRHGNLLRWASRVSFARGQRLAAIDVIFLGE